jgi:hypothetical protein
MMWSIIIGKILTTVMSWLDASNLRNKMFQQAEEAEIMMTALEDIERMDKGGKISQYARKAIDTVKGLPNDTNSR